MNKGFLIVIILILIYSRIKKVDALDLFQQGLKEGLQLFIPLFCSMLSFYFFSQVILTSSLLQIVQKFPFINQLPPSLISQILLKPFSFNGSLILLQDLYQNYGLNHFYSQVATLIQVSFDSTFYLYSLYLISLPNKKKTAVLTLSLILNGITVIFCFLAVIIFF